MKILPFQDLKKIENENPKASKVALLRSAIAAATVAGVLIVLAPSIKDIALSFSLVVGVSVFFITYSTTMYEIKLLKELGRDEENAENEADNA